MEERNRTSICRVAIVGAQRLRVAKVASLLISNEEDSNEQSVNNPSISVEYVPCVATFASYENASGESIRYLASVEHHALDGKERKGSSLAPFFDTRGDQEGIAGVPSFSGVSAFAIGCGIDAPDDIQKIKTFVDTLSGTGNKSEKQAIAIECVTPNQEYSSMKEENEAYKALDADGKDEAIRLQTIGPGKMAKFSAALANQAIHAAQSQNRGTGAAQEAEKVQSEAGRSADDPNETIDSQPPEDEPTKEVDPAEVRYACRRCRTILFGKNDLEDPPHTPSEQNFSWRKMHHGGSNITGNCESIFLASGAEWMGDLSAAEGKFVCPRCNSKLGSYSWSGAQCSCGTWVSPAIQVPGSKVDVMKPNSDAPPPGTITSPLTAAMINPSSIIYMK